MRVIQSARAEPFNQMGARKPWRPDQLAPQRGMRLCCAHMDQILGGSTVPAVAFCTLPEGFFRSAPRAVDGTQERHANGKPGGRFACRHVTYQLRSSRRSFHAPAEHRKLKRPKCRTIDCGGSLVRLVQLVGMAKNASYESA